MEDGLAIFTIILLAIIVVVSALMVYATKRHKRYVAALPKDVIAKFPALKTAYLPSLTKQDKAYLEAQAWLERCKASGVVTWLAGKSRASMLHIQEMYPWDSGITFHYVSPTELHSGVGWLDKETYLNLRRDAMAPAGILYGSFGKLKEVPYAVVPGVTRHILPKAITLPRRDVLDWFRYPPAMSDTIVADVVIEH